MIDKLTAQQQQLVTDNIRLAYYFVRQAWHQYPSIDRDVIESASYLALINASRTFDPTIGEFGSYASSALRRAIWQTAVKERGRQKRVGAEMVVEPAVCDTTPDLDEPVDVHALLAHARPRDRECIIAYFLHGQTYRQIAATMGVVHERVRQRIERGLRAMRKAMGVKVAERVPKSAADALELYRTGKYTQLQLAELCGISFTTMHNRLVRARRAAATA